MKTDVLQAGFTRSIGGSGLVARASSGLRRRGVKRRDLWLCARIPQRQSAGTSVAVLPIMSIALARRSPAAAAVPVPAPAPEVSAPVDTAALYRDYGAAVARWATKLARSAHEAEDIVQEVFLVVHRRLGELTELRSPAPWLFRITENIVRRRWRNQLRSGRSRVGMMEQAPEAAPSPLDELERRRMLQRLEQALEELGAEDRNLLYLCDVRRLPTSDVTAMTGIKPQTLRVRRFRARAQIAQWLRDDKPANETETAAGSG
jgi:RNA polymerase sigma-70 factor (ECF subfamily)